MSSCECFIMSCIIVLSLPAGIISMWAIICEWSISGRSEYQCWRWPRNSAMSRCWSSPVFLANALTRAFCPFCSASRAISMPCWWCMMVMSM